MKNKDIEEWIKGIESKLFTPISQKQVTFLESTADVCLGGGSRGGGKSLVLAYDSIAKVRVMNGGKPMLSIDFKDYTALLIRRTYSDLIKNFKPFVDKFAEAFNGIWVERRKCYEFPSGAKVYLTHLDAYRDVKKYIGGNYHYIGIEEVNQFPFEWVEMLRGSLRTGHKYLKAYLRMTSNPGGIGNSWLKEKIVDRCPTVPGKEKNIKRYDITYIEKLPGKPFVDNKKVTWQYVPFGVLDNPILLYTDPSYIRYLDGLEEPLRSMWLFGDWTAQVGQYFSWNPMYHIIDEKDFKLDPDIHTIYRCMDYGTSNPFACLFVAVDESKNITVFDEIVESGLSVTPQTKAIHMKMAQLGLHEEDIFSSVADPAYWIKNLEMDETPISPAGIYFENGIRGMQAGINDRIAGGMLMRDLMRIPDIGNPKIRFTSNCVNCISHFPSLVSDVNRPEDVDTDGNDHEYDALRYLSMFIYPEFEPKEAKKKGWRWRLQKEQKKTNAPSWAM